jgi:hypothetical protein
MVCVPTARLALVSEATPSDRPVALNSVVPSRELTVPVGVPDEDEMAAINDVVTACGRNIDVPSERRVILQTSN